MHAGSADRTGSCTPSTAAAYAFCRSAITRRRTAGGDMASQARQGRHRRRHSHKPRAPAAAYAGTHPAGLWCTRQPSPRRAPACAASLPPAAVRYPLCAAEHAIRRRAPDQAAPLPPMPLLRPQGAIAALTMSGWKSARGRAAAPAQTARAAGFARSARRAKPAAPCQPFPGTIPPAAPAGRATPPPALGP